MKQPCDPPIPGMVWDEEYDCWQGHFKLEAWSVITGDVGYAEAVDSGGPFPVMLGGGSDWEFIAQETIYPMVVAWKYTLENQEKIRQSILTTLFKWHHHYRAECLQEYEEFRNKHSCGIWCKLFGCYAERWYQADIKRINDGMPSLKSVEDLYPVIGLAEIFLLEQNKDGIAYVGYQFGCDWDTEHGLGVVVYKDQVVSIGQAADAMTVIEGWGMENIS